MSIDWFTFFAQIVNFLIVVFLLRRFLYGPILRAMAEREAKIAAEFEQAEAIAREAEEEGNRYRAQRAEIDAEIDTLMTEAAAKAAERRKAMVAEAREEVESMQDRWYAAVEHEKQLFLFGIRTRLGEQVFQVAQAALSDLAGAELEEAIVNVFLDKLHDLDMEAAAGPAPHAEAAQSLVIVRSAFDLAPATQQRIKQAFQYRVIESRTDGRGSLTDAAPVDVEFELAPDLICGIETQLQNRRIAWNLRDYLNDFEEGLAAAFTTDLHAEERRAHLYEQDAAANGILPG